MLLMKVYQAYQVSRSEAFSLRDPCPVPLREAVVSQTQIREIRIGE